MVTTNALWVNSIFVPDNAVQLNISVVPNTNSPIPFPDLPIYVKQSGAPTNTPGGYDIVRTNQVSLPPDLPLNPVGVDLVLRHRQPHHAAGLVRSGYRPGGHQRTGQLSPGAGGDERLARGVLSLRIGHQHGRGRCLGHAGPDAGVLPAAGPHQQPRPHEGPADQRRPLRRRPLRFQRHRRGQFPGLGPDQSAHHVAGFA